MSGQTTLYCRVSTADQSLTRQRTSDYATDTLGIDPSKNILCRLLSDFIQMGYK
jgi:hypothetical protein